MNPVVRALQSQRLGDPDALGAATLRHQHGVTGCRGSDGGTDGGETENHHLFVLNEIHYSVATGTAAVIHLRLNAEFLCVCKGGGRNTVPCIANGIDPESRGNVRIVEDRRRGGNCELVARDGKLAGCRSRSAERNVGATVGERVARHRDPRIEVVKVGGGAAVLEGVAGDTTGSAVDVDAAIPGLVAAEQSARSVAGEEIAFDAVAGKPDRGGETSNRVAGGDSVATNHGVLHRGGGLHEHAVVGIVCLVDLEAVDGGGGGDGKW